jgi:hypothetical protein
VIAVYQPVIKIKRIIYLIYSMMFLERGEKRKRMAFIKKTKACSVPLLGISYDKYVNP